MEKSPLDHAADSVYEQLDAIGGNPLLLAPVLQPIALLYTFQAMVDNGGFQYPMENDFPFTPPYSAFSEAYRQIGAEQAAINLDKAVALFPFSHPELENARRLEFFASIGEDHEFYILSDLVCGDKTVWLLMGKYVMAHPDSFRTTPENIN
jgi:hypothetical protein